MWETSHIIRIHEMRKPLDSSASFWPISLSPNPSQSFLNASFYLVYSPFWSLISFFLPVRPFFALDGLLSIKFCFFLSPFSMGLTNSGRVLGRFLLLSTSPRYSILSGTPLVFINLLRMALLLNLLVGLNLSFLSGALVWFFKITKVVPFESVDVFRMHPFLAVFFSFFITDLFASLFSSGGCTMSFDLTGSLV